MKTKRKLRLYLDTSIIIMLEHGQDPVRQAMTNEFFRIVAEHSDDYELLLSRVTIDELNAGSDEEKANADSFLATLEHTRLPEKDEAENLAWIYALDGVLSESHINDLTHIAYAVVSRCDYVVTWNMRHLANPHTVKRVNDVNALEKYASIIIETPRFFIGEFDEQ